MTTSSEASSTVIKPSPEASRTWWPSIPLGWWLAGLLVGALWLLTFNQLRLEWTINELYNYGWAIPFLAGYLLYERWLDRPEPKPWRWPLWSGLAGVILLGYLPIRLLQEANPDWILINWALAAVAVSFSLIALLMMGGLPWLRHFGFPILFTLTAVAWPVGFENWVMQSLMASNAMITAEIMTILGWPAMAIGNLIEIGSSVVDVDEACSGFRSLQTAFMMSFFFGEFYRLNPFMRVLLVGSSFLVAYLLNLGRTVTLTYIGASQSLEALDQWHDPLGNAVLILCLASLWLLAMLFQFKRATGKVPAGHSGDSSQPPPEVEKKDAPASPPAMVRPPRMFPIGISIFGLGFLLAAEASTEVWYRRGESNLIAAPAWEIQWPETALNFRTHEFTDGTRAILKYNEGTSATWQHENGLAWSGYYLRWNPGRVSKSLAGAHSPDICLPATGYEFVRQLESFTLNIGDLVVPVRSYLFRRENMIMFMYHAIVQDRFAEGQEAVDLGALDRRVRIDSALQGVRNQGQRVFGISLMGAQTEEVAREEFTRLLQDIVVFTDR